VCVCEVFLCESFLCASSLVCVCVWVCASVCLVLLFCADADTVSSRELLLAHLNLFAVCS
jgi:hypothetical protein